MFPKWEFDVEDTPAENIIKLMFVKKPWKWTMDCGEVTDTWVNTKPTVVSPAKKKVVKEDSPRPRKKARKEASEDTVAVASEEAAAEAKDIKTMFKDIVDAMREGFGTCLKEIKYLCICFVSCILQSESVNGTNAGRKSLSEDKGPDVAADASSSKDKAPEPSLLLLDKNQSTDARYLEKRDASLALYRAKMIIPNKNLYPGYNPFAPIDKKKLKELADWLKTCPHYRTPLDKKPRTSRTWWYQILRTSLEWLEDCHIDAWINVLRKRYDANPQHFRSERMCFLDHLFAQQWRFNYKDFKDSEPDQNGLGRRLPVNYNETHWIAMWISIPKRHIVVWDSICSSISPEELDVYIECHALGIAFSKKDFAKANGKTMRDKMAVDIFQELPDAHEFENKDNDANLGAYEGRLTVKSSGMLDDLTISSLESLLSSDLL
ncbi:BnaCnng72850D [Brassica napus]|uniref:BnaCnng72850D protein n=3 Tax=Brassica napus TaxID=3708 RepID=A0A078K0V0_BRANA|nr:BnaCnng72850D [Brassica napus]